MAFVTGTAADLNALRSAIFAACTANGWTLNGEVLSRGGVFVRIQNTATQVSFLGGTGIDGANNLTGGGTNVVRIRAFAEALSFPMTYEVHLNTAPDEVYVVVNYNVNFFQWAAWGRSTIADLPGTGVWYAASQSNSTVATINIADNSDVAGTIGHHPVLLGTTDNAGGLASQNGFVQHGLDAETWNPQNNSNRGLLGWRAVQELQSQLPNTWNQETVLLPIHCYIQRTSGNKVTLIADVQHARYCRIDFVDPGDIIVFGPDRWRVYPWYRKDVVNRDGGSSIQHTGTFGFAVRYTGP